MEYHAELGQNAQYYNGLNWNFLDKVEFQSELQANILKIATYNVLFGWKISAITQNKMRFQFILNQLIPQNAPDILILNEVTPEFLSLLKANIFIQNNYHITPLTLSRTFSFHGLMILSKYQFRYYVFQASNKRFQLGLFNINTQPFLAISCHLDAYEGRVRNREQEIKHIDQFLRKVTQHPTELESKESEYYFLLCRALQNNNIFLLGDMNLHFPNETQAIYKYNFLDLWVEHDEDNDDPGFTWDAQTNTLISWMLPFDNRRMRLDRILVRKDNSIVKSVREMTVEGKEKLGWYLSASDHFMLLAELELQDQPNRKYQQRISDDQVRQRYSAKYHGFRHIKMVIILRLLIVFGIVYLGYLGISKMIKKKN